MNRRNFMAAMFGTGVVVATPVSQQREKKPYSLKSYDQLVEEYFANFYGVSKNRVSNTRSNCVHIHRNGTMVYVMPKWAKRIAIIACQEAVYWA